VQAPGAEPIPQNATAQVKRSGCAWWLLILLVFPGRAHGDLLVGNNGERFFGKILEETATNVVFESEFAGKLTIPQSQIRDLERGVSAPPTNAPAAAVTNIIATGSAAWKPPGVGTDGADWVQLKSGEWLRGELKYIQNKEVEFNSDEMDEQTLKLKDVRRVYTAHRVFSQFDGREPVYGKVVVSNDVVRIAAEMPVELPLDSLLGITPSGGTRGIRTWTGNLSLGLSLESGNHHQTSFTTKAELLRLTPNTKLDLNYLGNYSELDGAVNANNDRVNLTYDVRLNRDWFVRPVQFEYYRDPLANIANRYTLGVGGGYYIFDRSGLEWTLSAGPSFQYTRFSTVQTNEDETVSTPAGVLQSKFEADITSRLTLKQTWQVTLTKQDAGLYTHHSVSTLEFDITKYLSLDVSLIWDYLQNPQRKADGTVPQKNDTYLTVGCEVDF
jgi:putative salt-induced outer membrane protein YdiY